MPWTLSVICYKQSPIFPTGTAHWGLYLNEEEKSTGTVFHVSKTTIIGGMTDFGTLIEEPASSRSLLACVEIASGLDLTDRDLIGHCRAVSENRPFDLLVNNCQRWCAQVLERLVSNGIITQVQYDALASKGFKPLI